MGSTGFPTLVEGRNIQHEWGTEVLLEAFVRQEGIPVLNIQPYVTIYRLSDLYVLDRATDTFVPAGYPYGYEMLHPMTEFTDGLYHYFFDQSKYVDPNTLKHGTDEDGNQLFEGYSLVYRCSYVMNGKNYDGVDYELHMFGTGPQRLLKILYDQHRRLLHKHKQFDPTDMDEYKFCTPE